MDAALHLALIQSTARALGWFLASVAPWPAHAGVFRGGRATRGGRQEAPYGTTPFGTAQVAWELRVATSLPAHACSTVAVAWHAQGALCAADVPHGRSIGDRP